MECTPEKEAEYLLWRYRDLAQRESEEHGLVSQYTARSWRYWRALALWTGERSTAHHWGLYWEGRDKPSTTPPVAPKRAACGEWHGEYDACNECDFQAAARYEF